MDEPYLIEILHIVNPHVIFIESQAQKEPVIEQVGLFGVLPVNKTIDIDGEVQVNRCANWAVATNTILRELIAENKCRAYFVPVEGIDERRTIFDENIYKFGDIIIESRKNISVTEYLVNASVAIRDDHTFVQKLKSGDLKLKLNTECTEKVLTAIKKYYKKHSNVDYDWKETLNKQTVFHQNAKKITAELTEKNLKLLEETSAPICDIRKVIEIKERDLEFCKEADLVSVGCGVRRQSHTNSSTTSGTKSNTKHSSKLLEYIHGRKVAKPLQKSITKVQHSTPKQDSEKKPADNFPVDLEDWDEIPEKKEPEAKLKENDDKSLQNYSEDLNLGPKQKASVKNPNKEESNRQKKNLYDFKEDISETLTPNKGRKNNEINNKTEKPEKDEQFSENHEQEISKNKFEDCEDYHHGNIKKSSPVKSNRRRIVYCPDMEMSDHNVKNLITITVSENSAENYANTVEEFIGDNKKKINEVSNLSSQFKKQKDIFDDVHKAFDDDGRKIYECNDETDNSDNLRAKTVEFSHKADKVTNKSNVGIKPVVPLDVIKRAGPGKKGGRLNTSQLQEKLFALEMSRKNRADNSGSSKSDLSSDQIDSSLTNKENVSITKQSLLVAKTRHNEISNVGSEDMSIIKADNKNTKSSVKALSRFGLQTRLRLLKSQQERNETSDSTSDTSAKDSSSTELSKKLALVKVEPNLPKNEPNSAKDEPNHENPIFHSDIKPTSELKQIRYENLKKAERNVNPFKNLEGSKSVFVEKLVSPTLMVHTKNDNLILPKCELTDIPFKTDTRMILKTMHINKPKRLQTVTWGYILRGHSMFVIGPAGNGKTLGYVPAICNLISDARTQFEGVGPICIIVCATALSVSEVENLCKRFLSVEEKIVTFYPGIDTTKVITELLNGCHLLICTAPALVYLLETDFGVDLRRLGHLVFDDCERLSQVYDTEINQITKHVNLMLKTRADKALKVQYVVASRQWCDFMTPLAIKAPDTVIAIGASQECVLYSKTHTSVNIVNNHEKKMDLVLEFLEEIDFAKRTVIVCREDEEVDMLAAGLKDMRYTVFSCNSSMTLHDLYKLSEAWNNYNEPISGPILVCCDGNLTHLNITNANYLLHYSLPSLFSMFCKRYFVLNENYASIFAKEKSDVKIKILMDKANVEQLPKILHFVKRCTNEQLSNLDDILQEVIKGKDMKKAERLTPICNNLLMLGNCVDVWNCADRHTFFEKYDQPKDWMPKNGVITFKITHFDSAVTYSARVLSIATKTDSVKLPNNVNTLALKMGRHYSKEVNRKLHGKPNVGDICAVASQQSLFERCRVLKVIPSDRKNAYHVLINLLDKEQMTIVSDVELYYLPEDLKAIETYVVKVRLANLQPKDRDVTFSIAAKDHLHKVTELDRESGMYMKGKVAMSLGNCIFVETAEACVDLTSLGETVVKRDFKLELIGCHAEPNSVHIAKLKKLIGEEGDDDVEEQKNTPKTKTCPKWAHLDKDDFTSVIFATITDANTILVRHTKFLKVTESLQKDIQVYVKTVPEISQDEIFPGNIVLAEFPDDKQFERARIDHVIDDMKVNCFFVDNGDWRHIAINKLKPISDTLIQRIPFQAIECRLVGVKPPGSADWPEFSTSWLDDNCFENKEGNAKHLFLKYFTKEPATVTGGHKYGVAVIDTNSDQDVVINKLMIELNLAKEIDEEMKYIDEPFDFLPLKATDSSEDVDFNDNNNYDADKETSTITDLVPMLNKKNDDSVPFNVLFEKPIRSVPLVDSDNESDVSDKWDVNVDNGMLGLFGQPSKENVAQPKATINEVNDMKNSTKSNHLKKAITYENIPPKSQKNKAEANKIEDLSENVVAPSGNSGSSFILATNSKNTSQLLLKSSLDSDDVETEDERNKSLDVSIETITRNNITKKSSTVETKSVNFSKQISKNDTLDSDDLSSVANDSQENDANAIKQNDSADLFRKPKIVWRQNKTTVTLKIILIGVEDYVLELKDKNMKFETWHNDTQYGFEFDLYGVILPQKCIHSNKGQYILVTLAKMLPRNWLNLTKDLSAKKWITYDVDALNALDSSSDNDDDVNNDAYKVIKSIHEKVESASEDEEFTDDLNFTYKRE